MCTCIVCRSDCTQDKLAHENRVVVDKTKSTARAALMRIRECAICIRTQNYRDDAVIKRPSICRRDACCSST